MKQKILSMLCSFLVFAICSYGQSQKPVYPKPNSNQIPFGKKLPLPLLSARDEAIRKMYGSKAMNLPHTTFDTLSKQFIVTTPGGNSLQHSSPYSFSNSGTRQNAISTKKTTPGFHLT